MNTLAHETPAIVTHDAWRTARLALLAREKDLTRLHDQIARERDSGRPTDEEHPGRDEGGGESVKNRCQKCVRWAIEVGVCTT